MATGDEPPTRAPCTAMEPQGRLGDRDDPDASDDPDAPDDPDASEAWVPSSS